MQNISNILFSSNLNIFFATIIFLFTIAGFFRGFVYSIINLFTLVLSLISAINFNHLISPFIVHHINNDIIVNGLSLGILFLISVIILTILFEFAKNALKPFRGGIIDRTVGLIYGFTYGNIFSLIIFWSMLICFNKTDIQSDEDFSNIFIEVNSETQPSWIVESEATKYGLQIQKKFWSVYPTTLAKYFDPFVETLKKIIVNPKLLKNEINE